MSGPDSSSHLPPFAKVERLSDEFRAAKEPPSMVAYLGKIKDGLRPTLLRNLLQIDLERRRLAGDTPTADDYLQWLPEHESLIREEFLESISASRASNSDATVIGTANSLQRPAASRLGEYHLVSELGHGGMGVVYEAIHGQRNDRVAVKVLPEVEPESLHRFKREFRALSDLNHPNLVGLHSLECDGDQWFFTMDLINGGDFLSWVRPNDQLDEARLRAAFAQLVAGVLALHANQIIHRDIKPSNVMVDENGRVYLLDFGLVIEIGDEHNLETVLGIAGTPSHMSPEQAAGRTVTAASDWYSVGVVLFEALTGRLPFTGSALQMIHLKQANDPPALEESADIPEDLRRLCSSLLQKNPEDRPDELEIVSIASTGAPETSKTAHSRDIRLIGRDEQLAQLGQFFSDFQSSNGSASVFVDGRSGEGKTSLCEAFLASVQNQNLAIMSGRCYDRESVPFKALDSTIDAVASFLKALPAGQVAAYLPRDIHFLIDVFPIFGRIGLGGNQPTPAATHINDHERKTRAILALRELLNRLSDDFFIILFVDDLQWGDADSAEVLVRILQPPDAPRIFFLGTYRTDEADDSLFLDKWNEVHQREGSEFSNNQISVGSLTKSECTELAIDLLQKDNAIVRARAEQFFEQVQGNAFLLIELIGCFDPGTNSLRAMPVHKVIEEKLSRLPADSQQLLHVIAVSRQALDGMEAANVAGHEVVPTSTFTRMRSERLIRFVGGGDRIDTYHDRIREAVLAYLPTETRRECHRRFAAHIEQEAGGLSDQQLGEFEQGSWQIESNTVSSRLFDLVLHYGETDEQRRTFAYAFYAGEQARRQFALEVAARQFRRAIDCSESCCDSTSRQLLARLGDALRLQGRYTEADEALLQAYELSQDAVERCEISVIRADGARGVGRYAESEDEYRAALKSIGVNVPRRLPMILFGIARHLSARMFRTVWRKTIPRAPDRREHVINQLLNGLLMSVWFRNTPSIIWCSLAVLNRSEIASERIDQVHAHLLQFIVSRLLGLKSRAVKFEALAKSAIADDDLSSRLLHSFYGMGAAYSNSEFLQCQSHANQGLKLYEQTGDLWRALIMRMHMILSDFQLGNLGSGLECALTAFDESVRQRDSNTSHDYINTVAQFTDGNFDFPAMEAVLIPSPDNFQNTSQLLQGKSRWHLFHGRTREALEAAEGSMAVIRKHQVFNHITAPTFPLLQRILRVRAADLESTQPEESQRLWKRGDRFSAWACRFTKNFPDYAASLRERALYFEKRGKTARAVKLLQQSCAVATARHQRFEVAQSEFEIARVRYALGQINSKAVEKTEVHVRGFTDQVDQLRGSHLLLK